MMRFGPTSGAGRMETFQRLLLIILLISFLYDVLKSQHASGLYNDDYSGIHGVIANPASAHHGQLDWDINIVGTHLFVQQNYAFAHGSNLIHLLRNSDNLEVASIYSDEPFPDGSLVVDFDGSGRSKSVSVKADIFGPSVMVRKNKWAFSLFTRLRGEGGIPSMDANLGYYQFHNLPFDLPVIMDRLQGAGMVWGEVALGVAYTAPFDRMMSLGVNLKYLVGYEGGYGATSKFYSLERDDRDNLILEGPVANLSATDGFLNFDDFTLSQKGRGVGIDIGISKEEDSFRWGVSILDLGFVHFRNDAEVHQLNSIDSLRIHIPDFTSRGSLEGIIEEVNEITETGTLTGNKFSVLTPARIRIEGDRFLGGSWHLAAVFSMPIVASKKAIVHKSYLGISPRFQKRWVTVNLPVVIDHFRSLRVGAGMRIGFLTFGTDDLMSIFGRSKLNGSSFYMALKVNPFRTAGRVGANRNSVGCPF